MSQRAGKRQRGAAERGGAFRVMDFIVPHLLDHGARKLIIGRQPIQVAVQMLLDLAFGLGHETQAHAIAGTSGQQPDGECAAVPEWIQQAGTAAELLDAGLRPRQVVGLFARSLLEHRAQGRIARRQRLGVVQRLGADFTDVIDPHQRRGFPPFSVREFRLR